MRPKVYDILARKGITLLAILWLFTVFSGGFGCKSHVDISKPENFKYLEGTLVHLYKKILVVKSNDGQKINFRVGRRTVFIPEGWPGIGDRLRVRYLDNVFSHRAIGDYFIAYEVRKLDYPTDLSREETAIAIPSPEIRKEKPTISESEKTKIAILEFQGLNQETKRDNIGKMVTEITATSPVNSKPSNIIEREELSEALKEFKMSLTGVVDAASAKEMGKILGGDAIITGSVMMLRNKLRLEARIIDVVTGAIVAAESTLGRVDIQTLGLMCDNIVGKIIKKYYKESLNLLRRAHNCLH